MDEGGLGQRPEMVLLSWQLKASSRGGGNNVAMISLECLLKLQRFSTKCSRPLFTVHRAYGGWGVDKGADRDVGASGQHCTGLHKGRLLGNMMTRLE